MTVSPSPHGYYQAASPRKDEVQRWFDVVEVAGPPLPWDEDEPIERDYPLTMIAFGPLAGSYPFATPARAEADLADWHASFANRDDPRASARVL